MKQFSLLQKHFSSLHSTRKNSTISKRNPSQHVTSLIYHQHSKAKEDIPSNPQGILWQVKRSFSAQGELTFVAQQFQHQGLPEASSFTPQTLKLYNWTNWNPLYLQNNNYICRTTTKAKEWRHSHSSLWLRAISQPKLSSQQKQNSNSPKSFSTWSMQVSDLVKKAPCWM